MFFDIEKKMFFIFLIPILIHYTTCGPDDFVLIHIGDLNSKYEATKPDGSPCIKSTDNPSNDCVGGMARVVTTIKKLQNESEETPITVFTGGVFGGSVFWYVHGIELCTEVINLISFDAGCLGTNEFNKGDFTGLNEFTSSLDFSMVLSNANLSKFDSKVLPSKIIEKNGHLIGILGLLSETRLTQTVEFTPAYESLKTLSRSLKDQGAEIIILLSYYKKNNLLNVLKQFPFIDLVVTTTDYLWNDPTSPYPLLAKSYNEKTTPIVGVPGNAQYVGKLYFSIAEKGKKHVVEEVHGERIFLSNDVVEDEDTLKVLEERVKTVDELKNKTVTNSYIPITGDACSSSECSLGNIVADAFVHSALDEEFGIAIVNSGYLPKSLTNEKTTKDNKTVYTISEYDVANAFPNVERLYKARLKGSALVSLLIASAVPEFRMNEMVQVSGMQNVFDSRKKIERDRLLSSWVLCRECESPGYEKLNPRKYYTIVTNKYQIMGGGSPVFLGAKDVSSIEITDVDAVIKYLKSFDPIYASIERRMVILPEASACSHCLNVFLLFLISIMLFFF